MALIDDLVRGEDRSLPRAVDLSPIAPDTLEKAWLTVKADVADTDEEAIFQKIITTDASSDGQIDDAGTGDPLAGHLVFLIPSEDTLKLEANIYYRYDIKGVSSSGAKKVLEGGFIVAKPPITQADS